MGGGRGRGGVWGGKVHTLVDNGIGGPPPRIVPLGGGVGAKKTWEE